MSLIPFRNVNAMHAMFTLLIIFENPLTSGCRRRGFPMDGNIQAHKSEQEKNEAMQAVERQRLEHMCVPCLAYRFILFVL